jgi:hypothetical protein
VPLRFRNIEAVADDPVLSVTPAMDVLVAIEAIARERRAPLLAAHLELV